MKKLGVVIVICLLFHNNVLVAQYCNTPTSEPDYLQTINPVSAKSNGNYHINIAIHIIHRSDGTGGVTEADVDEALYVLGKDFSIHKIYFEVIEVDHINNDIFFNYQHSDIGPDDDLDGKFDSFQPNKNFSAIDIYIFPSDGNFKGGKSGGIPSKTFAIGGRNLGFELLKTHVISHEMGHCLGLYHTFHGTLNCSPTGCPELVNGDENNCTTCGDYVCDTPPDPQTNNINENCEWNGIADCTNNLNDSNGDPYNPDPNLIMSYNNNYDGCNFYHTVGQGLRMRTMIQNHHYLQEVLIDEADLYTRDDVNDEGKVPNTAEVMWESPDIWVRNQKDGFVNQEHENAELDNINPPYVYIRVTNTGDLASDDQYNYLYLYWGKANGNFPWPSTWNGSQTYTNGIGEQVPSGDLIGIKHIPKIEPGKSIILRFEWVNPPNPEDYYGTSNLSEEVEHTCLLTRIVGPKDNINFSDGSNIAEYVIQNNNVAWKNVAVYNNEPDGFNPISELDDDVEMVFTLKRLPML